MNTVHEFSRGKLVRDKIPDLIRSTGTEPVIRIAQPDEYPRLLRAKLTEEAGEFLASGDDVTELADLTEVVYALARSLGYDPAHLEDLRVRKAAERGSFDRRYVWYGNHHTGRLP